MINENGAAFLPEWYIDPRGLPPDLAQLVHRINALPHGKVRDQLIENMNRAIDMVSTAMGEEKEGLAD